MRLTFILISILAFVQLAFAQTASLTVETQYIDTAIPASSVPLSYKIYYHGDDRIAQGTILPDDVGTFIIDAFWGFAELSVSADNPSTEGFDFFGQTSFFVNESKSVSVVLFPVGSARVLVVDEKRQPVEAPVRIDCSRSNGVQGYFNTDKFGVVKADFLPVGNCVFRSAIKDIVISKNVEVKKGSKQEVVLELEGYNKNKKDYSILWTIGIIIILVSLIILFLKRKRKNKLYDVKEPSEKNKLEEVKEEEEKVIVSSAKEDIMTALNKKEKQVVKFLLEEQQAAEKEGKSAERFYISQATLVRGADIPKTSLARVLESLTQKNILNVEKIGKLKKNISDRVVQVKIGSF